MMLFYMKEVLTRQVKHSDEDAFVRALDDGRYEAIIIDANDGENGVVHIELTITTGAQKGDVITITATNMSRDALSLLGTPVTLVVVDGTPRIVFDA